MVVHHLSYIAQELVFIGQSLNEAAIKATLDACLVTADEAGVDSEEENETDKKFAHMWKLGLKDLFEDKWPTWLNPLMMN